MISIRFRLSAVPMLIVLLSCTAVLAQSANVVPAKSPSGITLGPDGAIWYADARAKSIGRIDPSGGATAFATPGRSPNGIATGADGNLWFTAYEGYIGQMTPAGTVREFALANATRYPTDITPDPTETSGSSSRASA